jgi:hypothetical protein
MQDIVGYAFALALGLVVGLGVGAARAFAIAERRRHVAGLNARMARFWPAELPARSATDILAGRVRVVLGGSTYDLPILPRAASRRWIEQMDLRFATLGDDLEAAGDDVPEIMNRLLAETDGLYELLRSYDQAGALPPADQVDEFATDTEILRAVLEVWRAANPLAATLAQSTTTSEPSEEPSSSQRPTAGIPSTSRG